MKSYLTIIYLFGILSKSYILYLKNYENPRNVDRWDREDDRRKIESQILNNLGKNIAAGKIPAEQGIAALMALSRAYEGAHLISQIQAGRIKGYDVSDLQAQLDALNHHFSDADAGMGRDQQTGQEILDQYMVKVFGDKNGLPTFFESSPLPKRNGKSHDYITVADLLPGEGGFTLSWTVDHMDAPIERNPFGTARVPIWKDKEGNIKWDQSMVQ